MTRVSTEVRLAVPPRTTTVRRLALSRFWDPADAPCKPSALRALVGACAPRLAEVAEPVVDRADPFEGWGSADVLKVVALGSRGPTGFLTLLAGTEKVRWLPRAVLDGYQRAVDPQGISLCIGALVARPGEDGQSVTGALLSAAATSWLEWLAIDAADSVLFVDATGSNAARLARLVRHVCRRLGADLVATPVELPRGRHHRALYACCPSGGERPGLAALAWG